MYSWMERYPAGSSVVTGRYAYHVATSLKPMPSTGMASRMSSRNVAGGRRKPCSYAAMRVTLRPTTVPSSGWLNPCSRRTQAMNAPTVGYFDAGLEQRRGRRVVAWLRTTIDPPTGTIIYPDGQRVAGRQAM